MFDADKRKAAANDEGGEEEAEDNHRLNPRVKLTAIATAQMIAPTITPPIMEAAISMSDLS
jgi:hypothetical protein